MADPTIPAVIAGKVLENPKEAGEAVHEAGKGVREAGHGAHEAGKGVREAAEGVGTAAEGIGGGFREYKKGDAMIVEAEGRADAERIRAMAELAEKIKDLPPEMQEKILDKADRLMQKDEARVDAGTLVATGGLAGLLVSRAVENRPGTKISGQENQGPLRAHSIEMGRGNI